MADKRAGDSCGKGTAPVRHGIWRYPRYRYWRWLPVCMAVLLLGCNKSQSVDTSCKDGKTVACHGRLAVEDGRLVDQSGDQVVLRGLGLGALSDVKEQNKWDEQYFRDARRWGAELVRLPINPATYRNAPVVTLDELDKAVAWCKKNQMYLIIDYHVIGNVAEQLFQNDENFNWEADLSTTWAEMIAFWEAVAVRYADEPVVAFAELYSEPAQMKFLGGSWKFAEWREAADRIIARIREIAPAMIPLVAGMDWAYDFSPGGQVPFTDPNIALAVHPFPGQARTDRQAQWDAAFGYLADHYPIVFTEVGFDPYDTFYPPTNMDDLSYGRAILNYAATKNISWTAFVFFNEPDVWPMPLFSDWATMTPTVSGQFFKDVLSGQTPDAAADAFGDTIVITPPAADGPSGFYVNVRWLKKGDEGNTASATWIGTPGTDGVAVHIESEGGAALAGMGLSLSWDHLPVDISDKNVLTFTGDITEGAQFNISLGRTEGNAVEQDISCMWEMTGRGQDTYTVNLWDYADWCDMVTVDMNISTISFFNHWGVGPATLDIRIDSLALLNDPQFPAVPDGILRQNPENN